MSDGVEKAILAGGCFWGMEDLFRKRPQQRRLGLPVVALVDTNCDPDDADFVIPGNDDAIRSCSPIVRVIADAIAAGASAVTVEEMAANGRPEEEPEAEQEREAEQPQEEVSSE